MMRVFCKSPIIATAVTIFVSSSVFAGGFEKAVVWSGKQAGVGGYGVSNVYSSEAVYFNPAGLAYSDKGDVSVNFSPTFSKFEGPLRNGSSLLTVTQNKGDRSLSPIFGATVSHKPSKKFGIGAGIYTVGGAKAVYSNLDYSQVNSLFVYQPRASTELAITEASFAAAYALTSRLALGFGWRVSLVQGDLWEPVFDGTTIFEVGYRDLSGVNYAGFRMGLLYSGDRFSVGWKLRTPISFTADGRLGYQAAAASESIATLQVGDGTDVTVSSTFPLSTEIGGHFALNNVSFLSLAYGYARYSSVDSLALTSVALGNSTTSLSWVDQHLLRVAYEHDRGIVGMPLRIGYVLNTPVVSRFDAKITFSSPAPAHTLSVGTGIDFGPFETNFAFEYAFAIGENASSSDGVVGDYQSNAFAFHTGLKYPF